jgi:hypothetical protein
MKKLEHFPRIFDWHDGKFHKFILGRGKQEQRKLMRNGVGFWWDDFMKSFLGNLSLNFNLKNYNFIPNFF